MNGRCILVAGLCAALSNLACAPVPSEGRFVRAAGEQAIIVWDEGAKREHFILRAAFDTDAKDFGFLVPTPSKPELGESGDAAFDLLTTFTAPAGPAAITVLEEKRVAGLDAAVLEAADAGALAAWLKAHGYPSSPALAQWYAPYVAAKWKITAFRIAADSPKVFIAAVRMSFQSEQPFLPCEDGLLRVYFIGEGRVAGTIGESLPWPGEAVWSGPLETGQLAKLLKAAKLPSMAGGGARWLTEFERRASARAAAGEVFFRRAAADTITERQPAVVYGSDADRRVIAGGLLALIIGAGAWWAWRRSRRGNG